MITQTQYVQALRIVEDYHEQIGLTSGYLKGTIFELQPGSQIKCVGLKKAKMVATLTIGKAYTILNREDDYIWIRNDRHKYAQYELSIEYWALADETTTSSD